MQSVKDHEFKDNGNICLILIMLALKNLWQRCSQGMGWRQGHKDKQENGKKPFSSIQLCKVRNALYFPSENHREESAFQSHLTAKVLVVSNSFLPPTNGSYMVFLPSRHFDQTLFSLPPVHLLQLLCSALPHCLLQAGCAFASKGNS